MELALKFLLAHILGDFVLQPDSWIKDKKENAARSFYLYCHICVHLFALLLVFAFNFRYWLGFLVILITHYIFDLIKVKLSGRLSAGYLFIFDQIAHLSVIAGVVYYYQPFTLSYKYLSTKLLLLLTAILVVTQVSSIIIKMVITRWDLSNTLSNTSLKNAGSVIGILERLFVFAFVVTNHWEGIGFLLAAKSVFRFGDLSKAEDRKLTEYILIGTLLSFGMAMLTGMLYLYLLKQL